MAAALPAAASASGSTHQTGNETQPELRSETIEACRYICALMILEGHYLREPAMGPKTAASVATAVNNTLERTRNFKHVRENLSQNVQVWHWSSLVFAAAIPSLNKRSVCSYAGDVEHDGVPQDNQPSVIVKHYASVKEDIQMITKLMHITRNLLVTPEPEIAQDLCAAVQFDQMMYQTIALCVNVTSKGLEGEMLDGPSRIKLNEIVELYKKLLVMTLQHAHNWTAKHDRNKMSFWLNVLFDEDTAPEGGQDAQEDGGSNSCSTEFSMHRAKTQLSHWIERNSRMCEKARALLRHYDQTRAHLAPGRLPQIAPLAWNWLSEGSVQVRADPLPDDTRIIPRWKEDECDLFEQNRLYGRVSREVDTWWLKVRDPNYDDWVVPMPSVEFAQKRTQSCRDNLFHRYLNFADEEEEEEEDEDPDEEDAEEEEKEEEDDDNDQSVQAMGDKTQARAGTPAHTNCGGDSVDGQEDDMRAMVHDYVDDEELDDDESYGEGLLTEIPNILDHKQIEALHMIVKSCILDMPGLVLTRAGENLQKTKCRIFLATEPGKALLRELLVFIAVWEQDEHSIVFQLTTQIVEAVHHSALIPHIWQTLRIPKDIVSPAQTVLLRLVDQIFRARNQNPPPLESKENMRDMKLLHFLFIAFRSRVVPECISLINLQEEVLKGRCDAADFPLDSWDMERAKDGLYHFLQFLNTVAECPETRGCLIQWEATYEMLALLQALDTGVAKKSLVEVPKRSANAATGSGSAKAAAGSAAAKMSPFAPSSAFANIYAFPRPSNCHVDRQQQQLPPPPPPPPPADCDTLAYKFPWAGIKSQLLCLIAALLQPPLGKSSPGHPVVQKQIVKYNGMVHLLNCCVYDDYNRYCRERVQICLKWLLDGSEDANNFLKGMVQSPNAPSGNNATQATSNVVPVFSSSSSSAAGPSAASSSQFPSSHSLRRCV